MKIYVLDENDFFTLTLLFFFSQNHGLHSSHSILREMNHFWGYQKNLTPKDKNANIIWPLLGLIYMGHPSHERET